MKRFFRNIHLYLGLAAGAVIAVVCFTGATLVFEKEMQTMLYPERYRVEGPGPERASLETMVASLRRSTPNATPTSVRVYSEAERTVEMGYEEGKRSERMQAFMHPATGEVVDRSSSRLPFFATMFSLHRWLLAGDTGKMIVGVSTLSFLVILITGIVLWWPRNLAILKHRLKMKWSAGWKRTNRDLHVVVGFYTALFLFVFAFTGLAWSFTWFNDGIYWITGSEKPLPPPRSDTTATAGPITLDRALATARTRMPDAEHYTISTARRRDDAVRVVAMPHDAVHERASNQMFLDQYSGSVIEIRRYSEQSLGQQVRSTFYPIHVGSIGGIAGRIAAFASCLAGFTFPITGTILWINRIRRKKGQTTTAAAATRLEERAAATV